LQRKGRAFIDSEFNSGFRLDSFLMALNHPLHDGVVDPNAWKVRRAGQALEYTKQLVIVRHVETRAIIGAMVHLLVTLNVAAPSTV